MDIITYLTINYKILYLFFDNIQIRLLYKTLEDAYYDIFLTVILTTINILKPRQTIIILGITRKA